MSFDLRAREKIKQAPWTQLACPEPPSKVEFYPASSSLLGKIDLGRMALSGLLIILI